MGSYYDTDLRGLEMFNEIMDCLMLLKTRIDVELENQRTCFGLYCNVPNPRVGLHISLTVAAFIWTKFLSWIKLIMSYLGLYLKQNDSMPWPY